MCCAIPEKNRHSSDRSGGLDLTCSTSPRTSLNTRDLVVDLSSQNAGHDPPVLPSDLVTDHRVGHSLHAKVRIPVILREDDFPSKVNERDDPGFPWAQV